MKFARLLVAVVAVTIGTVAADAGEKKVLYLNIKPFVGLGGTISRTTNETGNGEFHLTGGYTLLSLDKKGHIGLLGVGTAVNFSDFSANSAEIRDASRADGGYWGLAGYTNVVGTIVPIRIGPVAYQFSWNGHVKSLGRDRGRLHLITLDVVKLVRLMREY
ncbi:MAG: hypothetical protein AAB375_00615 [Patescibacteria group bacterium]